MSFYLSDYDDKVLQRFQESLLRLAEYSGLRQTRVADERRGSIWRLFRGNVEKAADSELVRKKAAEIDAAVSLALIGKAQAEVDAINAASMQTLIEGLKDSDAGCIQVGGNLVVKFLPPGAATPVVLARRLTVLEQRALEENPGITADPSAAFAMLAVAVKMMNGDAPAID
ncbi:MULTISPECIES: hypothetical protein [unclassified Nocardioides]|uniref:hypothetical protein n=1 Tax=unclassified Nocardioides TaxID=2615069 RepID=UPI0012E34A5A|nr:MULTISPECIES: hypothetical protein [unclassified Nocardioides]